MVSKHVFEASFRDGQPGWDRGRERDLARHGGSNEVAQAARGAGGKGPDFWCAFEDGEVVVIGDEPANTVNDRSRRRLLCRGAKAHRAEAACG